MVRLNAGAVTSVPSKAARTVTRAKKPLWPSGGSDWRRYLAHSGESSMPAFGDASHSHRGSGVLSSGWESKVSDLGRRWEMTDPVMDRGTIHPGVLASKADPPVITGWLRWCRTALR